MKKKSTTIIARRIGDQIVQVMPDGSTRPMGDRTDWAKLRAMTEEEVEAAARSDPDNPPFTEEMLKKLKPVPRVRTLRRALSLTQEEFSARYQIPIGTLRDWEQGRSEPDQPAKAYLKAIAHDPQGVARALQGA